MAKCGKACEVYSRIVGYLSPTRQWNVGKLAEFGARKTFDVGVLEAPTSRQETPGGPPPVKPGGDEDG